MAKNFYFENYENSMEQHLIEDLVVESIKIYGIDTWFLPRKINAKDDILNEDDLSSFDDAYQVEMYVKNVDSFEGEGDFLSKFGLQIRDSITLTIAQRTYDQEIGLNSTINRPREGDLIYLPLNNKYFVIQHVEHEAIFYQMGSLQTYDLRCDLFEYSGERFRTGQEELDNHFNDENIFTDTTGTTFTVEVRSAVFFMKDVNDKGDLINTPQLEARVGEVITFDQSHASNETHPLRIYTGTTPSNGAPVPASEISVVGIPGNEGAKVVWTPTSIGKWYYIKTTTVGMGDTITVSASKNTVELIDTFADNTALETFGDNIIDFSQNNPFGEDNF